MSFELRRKETFAENVARIARETLDDALTVLPEGGDAVHTARKDLKRLRALLRLARAGLGEEVFARENTALRDAGRVLSAVRDAQVLVGAFDALRGETVGRIAPETVDAMHRWLLEDVQATETTTEVEGRVPLAMETLRAVRDRLSGWPAAGGSGWRVPGRGLKSVFRRGRRAMGRAVEGAAEGDFHEWRKQVKYLAAHVRLLEPLRPKKLKRLRKTLDHVADVLGEEHDLSVLQAHLTGRPGTWASPQETELIGNVIDGHRQALQAKALALGGDVYLEKPARFGRRFKRDWKAWRAGT